jgi:hypothetical protein
MSKCLEGSLSRLTVFQGKVLATDHQDLTNSQWVQLFIHAERQRAGASPSYPQGRWLETPASSVVPYDDWRDNLLIPARSFPAIEEWGVDSLQISDEERGRPTQH